MIRKVLKTEGVVVKRYHEPNFDKACEQAYSLAVVALDIDEYGHSSIKGFDRSTSHVEVEFKKYQHTGDMGGHVYVYTFEARAVFYIDECDYDLDELRIELNDVFTKKEIEKIIKDLKEREL